MLSSSGSISETPRNIGLLQGHETVGMRGEFDTPETHDG